MKMTKFKKSRNTNRAIIYVFSNGFFVCLIIGVFLYSYNLITSSLASVSTSAGAVDFSNATALTMGKINTGLLNHGGLIALFLLFGQLISMVMIAYFTRDSNPSIFFIFEILILIFVYILATYISNAYETTLSAIPFSSIYTTNLNYATTFILKLPLIVTITGVIMMIIGYAGIPKNKRRGGCRFLK